jgi:hypothetical protein
MWAKSETATAAQHLLRIHATTPTACVSTACASGIYTGEQIVTGSQGRGDGVIERLVRYR